MQGTLGLPLPLANAHLALEQCTGVARKGSEHPARPWEECQGLLDREPRLRESCIRDGHLGKAGDRSQGPSRSWLAVNRKLCFLGPQLTPLPTSLTCLGTPALGQSLETGAF